MLKPQKRSAETAKVAGNEGPQKKKPANGAAPGGKFNKERKTFGPKVGENKFRGKPSGKPGGSGAANAGKYTKKFDGKPGDKGAKGAAPEVQEKTDWTKFKKEKKELKLKRKQAKDSYEVSIEAKQIYEKLKCRRTGDKNKLVEKLFNLISGGDMIKKLVMAHDTARVIQCMLKFASPALREQLSERLLPLVVDMAISKYSHFCVLRMLKYGSPSTKSKLVDGLFGHIVRLACHNISSKILDHIYLSVASAKQKNHMRQEFYGELYRSSKDESVKQLSDTYKETANMKASILGSVKSNLEHVANKQLVDSSLIHAVMLEYLRECGDDKTEETVTMYAPLVPLMLTTKDGSQAAIICFYRSSTKNRRAIIKTIKEHLVKICVHEHGHIFILALLNSLDDTKATKKAIYDTIHPELQTLMANQWGRRVVEWFISPGNTSCFHPTFIATIDEGLQYGKKDKELRRKEIFEQVEEPIASAIAEQPQFWLSDKHIGLVTAEILNKITTPHFVNAATALAAIVADPSWTVTCQEEGKDKKPKKPQDVEKIIAEATKLKRQKQKAAAKPKDEEEAEDESAEEEDDDEEEEKDTEEPETISVAGIEEAGLHVVLKKIIKHDKERVAADPTASTFGSLIVEQLTPETLQYWVTVNRACFVLLNIVENNNESTLEALKSGLKAHLPALKQQSASGAKLLLKKLAL